MGEDPQAEQVTAATFEDSNLDGFLLLARVNTLIVGNI